MDLTSLALTVLREAGGHSGHGDGDHEGHNMDDMGGGGMNDTSAANGTVSDARLDHRQIMAAMDMMPRGRMMALYAQKENFVVLFRNAIINNTGQFIGALIIVALFALITTIVIEIVKLFERKARVERKKPLIALGALAHAISLFFHYSAMLIVMSMNVWIILAVLVGHALGWLLFAGLENRIGFIKNLKVATGKKTINEDGEVVEEKVGGSCAGGCNCP